MYTLGEAYAEDLFCYYKNILLNDKQKQGGRNEVCPFLYRNSEVPEDANKLC